MFFSKTLLKKADGFTSLLGHCSSDFFYVSQLFLAKGSLRLWEPSSYSNILYILEIVLSTVTINLLSHSFSTLLHRYSVQNFSDWEAGRFFYSDIYIIYFITIWHFKNILKKGLFSHLELHNATSWIGTVLLGHCTDSLDSRLFSKFFYPGILSMATINFTRTFFRLFLHRLFSQIWFLKGNVTAHFYSRTTNQYILYPGTDRWMILQPTSGYDYTRQGSLRHYLEPYNFHSEILPDIFTLEISHAIRIIAHIYSDIFQASIFFTISLST